MTITLLSFQEAKDILCGGCISAENACCVLGRYCETPLGPSKFNIALSIFQQWSPSSLLEEGFLRILLSSLTCPPHDKDGYSSKYMREWRRELKQLSDRNTQQERADSLEPLAPLSSDHVPQRSRSDSRHSTTASAATVNSDHLRVAQSNTNQDIDSMFHDVRNIFREPNTRRFFRSQMRDNGHPRPTATEPSSLHMNIKVDKSDRDENHWEKEGSLIGQRTAAVEGSEIELRATSQSSSSNARNTHSIPTSPAPTSAIHRAEPLKTKRSTKQIQTRVLSKIHDPLTDFEYNAPLGHIYILKYQDEQPDADGRILLKIGNTYLNPYARMAEIERKCKTVGLEVVEDPGQRRFHYFRRAEKIIHRALAEFQRNVYCCQGHSLRRSARLDTGDLRHGMVETVHREWFLMKEEDAVAAVEQWRKFVETAYDEGGNLVPHYQSLMTVGQQFSEARERLRRVVLHALSQGCPTAMPRRTIQTELRRPNLNHSAHLVEPVLC